MPAGDFTPGTPSKSVNFLTVLMACLFLSACATTPQVTAVVGKRIHEGERDLAVTVVVTQMIGKHVGVGAAHQSEPNNGFPVDGDPEETSDSYGLALSFGGKPR